jgi:hypothetical protein
MSSNESLRARTHTEEVQRPVRKTRVQHHFIMMVHVLIRRTRSWLDRTLFRFRDKFDLLVNVFGSVGILISFLILIGTFKSPRAVRLLFFTWSIITTIAGFSKRFVTQRAVVVDSVNPDHFAFVQRLDESQSSEYKVVFNDSHTDAGLYYRQFSPEVLSGHVVIDSESFSIPDVVEKYADDVIGKLSSEVVNDKKVRLCTDLQRVEHDGPIRLQRTCYFDDRVTNNFAKYRLRSGEETILGHRFMVDRGGLVELEHASDLSNQLGGSTLLLTADKVLVLSEQARGSQENASRFASTGSGSFDWLHLVRLKKELDELKFSEFAISEIERELTEEVAFDPGMEHKTFLVGYGRYLYRNGKPEVFGLTVSKQSSRTLHVRHQEWDFLEKKLDMNSCVQALTSKSVLEGLKSLMQRRISLPMNSDHMSVPLLMNIETSMDYLEAKLAEGHDVIAEFYNETDGNRVVNIGIDPS